MQHWKTAPRNQIEAWIRQAALDFFETGDTDCPNWVQDRQEDGWTEVETDEFLQQFSAEIQKARDYLDDWSVGKA